MKKKLLMLMVPLMGTFFGYSQAEIIVTAPSNSGATTGLRGPNGLVAHTTLRGVMIIPASELTNIPASTIITKVGFLIATAGGPTPAGGNIQYYLENTADVTNLKPTDWATAIAPMTSVYNGAFSLPAVAGPTGDVTLTSSFTYTGGSLYVAYDYLGSTFGTTSWVYAANNSLAGSWIGNSDVTTTPPATLTATSAFRPCFRFVFANPFTNELSVTGVAGEKGNFNNTIKTTQTVTSIISNTSQGTLTNIPVTLNVTGANPYSVTQTIPSIASGASTNLLFNNVPTSALGAQTLTVSVPADQNNANNALTFNQQIKCDTIGYAQSPVQSGAVGFNTGAGLIAVRHEIPANIQTFVKSVSNYFPATANVAGNTMKGILLDGNGVILDSTASFTITAGMLNTKQDFNFINGAINVAGSTIYVGFRQDANATVGYFPFANQNNSFVDPNAAATFNLFGGGTAPLGSGLGYMMIEAVLTYGGFDVPNSSSNGSVCTNTALNITPTQGYTNYEFFVDGSSVQNGAASTYTTAPLTADMNYNMNITNGSCILNSNVTNITITSSISNTIAAAICPGQSYVLGTQTLNAGGTFLETFTSTTGCDSIVTLNLTLNTAATGTDTRSECNSFTWIDGNTYTSNNNTATFNIVGGAANGCDSLVTLNLTINTPTTGIDTRTECNSFTWINGTTYTASNNTATFNIVGGAANGCDSLVTLNLTINSVSNIATSFSGATITATNANATYQWLDCNNNNAEIANQTGQSFTATVNGSYAVELTQNGCVDTTSCITISSVGIVENSFGSEFTVYPNPTNGNFSIDLGTVYENTQITITDISGRLVVSKNMTASQVLNLTIEEAAGIYFVTVEADNKKAVIHLVKE